MKDMLGRAIKGYEEESRSKYCLMMANESLRIAEKSLIRGYFALTIALIALVISLIRYFL